MREVSVPIAAALLRVHEDTIRRRIARGALQARRGERGKLLVQIPDADAAGAAEARGGAAEALPPQDESERLRSELGHAQAMLAEVQAQRDALLRQVEQDAIERAELRRLLGNAQQQLGELARALPPALPEATQDARTRAESLDSTPATIAAVQTAPTANTLAQALKDVGVKKKQRRRLLARLAAAWRGE
jgi:chromosome segregation ATPase